MRVSRAWPAWAPRSAVVFGLALRLLNVVLVFGAMALLGRSLPTAGLGTWFLALSLALPVSLACQAGLGVSALGAMSRAMAEPGAAALCARAHAAGAWRGAALGLAASVGLGALGGWALGADAAEAALAGGVAGAALGYQATAGDILKGAGRPLAGTLLGGTLGNGVLLAVLAAAWAAGIPLDLRLALVATCAAHLLAAACAGLQIARAFPLAGDSLTRPVPIPWPADGHTLVLNQLAGLLYGKVDLWLAAALLSLEDAALYGAASRLVLLLMLPIEATEASIAPSLALALAPAAGRRALPADVREGTAQQLRATAAGAAVLWLGGDTLLRIAYGPAYGAAAPVLAILALALALRAALGPCSYALYLGGRSRLLLRVQLAAAAPVLALQAAGAWWGGLQGLAVASGVALVATNAAMARAGWHAFGVDVTIFGRP